MKRRDFIQIACVTSVGLLAGCKSMSSSKARHLVSADLVIFNNLEHLKIAKSAFSKNDFAAIAYQEKYIGIIKLTDNSFTAAILVCPHQGCGVEYSNNEEKQYVCPCHGARFTQQGVVIKGPATTNLTTLNTSSDQQSIYIQLP